MQELRRSPSPVMRNNILIALADLAVSAAALVDGHLPALAACIRDQHELVRRQALALLANLLTRDYVKWRGTLDHRWPCTSIGFRAVEPLPAMSSGGARCSTLYQHRFQGCGAAAGYAARVALLVSSAPTLNSHPHRRLHASTAAQGAGGVGQEEQGIHAASPRSLTT